MEKSIHPSLSWRSVVAGVFVSFFIFITLMSLGIALGGISLSEGIPLRQSTFFGGVWVVVSILFSLFIGSYMTVRMSNFESRWIAVGQSTLLASLFTLVVVWQMAMFVGWVTKSAGNVAETIAGATDTLNLDASRVVEDALGGVQFRSNPDMVVAGLAARLIRGDSNSAKTFLAQHTNLTVLEVDSMIEGLSAQIAQLGVQAKETAATAMKATGWSMFLTYLFVFIGSVAGGIFGVKRNQRTPLIKYGMQPAYT